jgi:transposase-like protein
MSSYPKSTAAARARQPRVVHKRNPQERQRLLSLFEDSGRSLRQFSHENDLSTSTLSYWRRQARRRAQGRARWFWWRSPLR